MRMPLVPASVLASLVEHLSEAILITDPEMRITHYLGDSARIYGWEAEEVLGRSLRTDFPLAFPDGDGEDFVGRLARLEQARVVMRCQRKDGAWLDLDVVATPLRDDAGRHTGWISVGRDVTGQFRALTELRASHDVLTDMVVGVDDGFWLWHIPSGAARFSQRWAAMLGHDLATLTPHVDTWTRHVHPDDLPQAFKALDDHTQGRASSYQCEYRVQHSSGAWLWVQDRGRVVERDATGTPVRVAGALTDITARKEMELALHAREAELRAALAANEALVQELRQALDRVRTLADLLPLCMHCRKVRDDDGYWAQIEEYVASHTDTSFSHGICPECLRTHYPEYPQ